MRFSSKKVDAAISNIADAYATFGNSIFLGHSGGKDSCVIHHLAYQVIPKDQLTLVHNVKPLWYEGMDKVEALTAMHADTLQFLYSHVCANFTVQMLHSSNMAAFITANKLCCQIDGARRSEHDRPGKSSNIIVDGKNVNRADMPSFVKNGIFGLSITYPIVDWTDEDVFDYLDNNEIPFSAEYMRNGEYDSYLKNR